MQRFSNVARATLGAPISGTDEALTLFAGGELFPALEPGDFFNVVLQDAAGIEIVRVGAHDAASNVLSNLLRGQEGTVARAFGAGAVVGLRVTAADMNTMLNAVPAHELAENPHPQYVTHETAAALAPVQSVAGRSGDVSLDVFDVAGAVPTTRSIIAGGGLVSGGTLFADVTIDLGLPETITATSLNFVSEDGHSHALSISKNDVGLGNADNTSDADKPISAAQQAALDLKLSANDVSVTNAREWTAATVDQAEAEAGASTTRRAWTAQRVFQAIAAWWNASPFKTKLDGIEAGAQVNAVTSVAGRTGAVTLAVADVSDFTAAAAAAAPVQSVAGKTGAVTLEPADVGAAAASHTHTKAQIADLSLSWTDITGKPTTFTPSAHSHAIADVTGLQTALDGKAASSHTHSYLPLSGGTLTGNITHDAGAVQHVASKWTSSGVTRWAMGREADGDTFRLWYYDSAGAYLGAYGFSSTGILTAGTFSGSGSGLTSLNASNLSTGTLPDARLSGTYTGVSITGNAATATKLATARSIALAGDVTGSASFDGSANISITATIGDDSHNHTIANVDGLQAALDAKLSLTGGSMTGDIIYGTNDRDHSPMGTYDPAKTQQIWSMGAAYRNSATGDNFGSLYGLAYKHTNNTTGGTMAGGHQVVWCQGGTPTAALGSGIWTSGTVSAAAFSGPLTGNAATATKLATARSISLAGDVTGSATFDGSANISITATIGDDSHNHTIANVDGLQTALNGKGALNTASKAASGWAKFGDTGVLIQWGRVTVASNETTETTITFPIAFPSACVQVITTDESSATGTQNDNFGIFIVPNSLTTTTCKVKNASYLSSWPGTNYCRYVAIGY